MFSLRKNSIRFLVTIFAFGLFLLPSQKVSASKFGCLLNTGCENIEADYTVSAQTQCAVRGGDFSYDPCKLYGCVTNDECKDVSVADGAFFHARILCKSGNLFNKSCTNLKRYGCKQATQCTNIFVDDYNDSGCEGELLRSLCPTYTGDCATAGACSTYRCVVISDPGTDPSHKYNTGDCREFQSGNEADAIAQARNLCAKNLNEADKLRIFRGPCASSEQDETINRGRSANELLLMASENLNPAGINNPTQFIKKAINGLMAFIGSITLLLYVAAGLLWMTARGASEQVDKVKKILVWTTLGVAVMLFSYILVSFLFSSIPT